MSTCKTQLSVEKEERRAATRKEQAYPKMAMTAFQFHHCRPFLPSSTKSQPSASPRVSCMASHLSAKVASLTSRLSIRLQFCNLSSLFSFFGFSAGGTTLAS